MAHHRSRRRSFRSWVRDDWSQPLGFRRAAQVVGAEPRLLLWLVAYFIVSFGVLATALAIFGQVNSLGRWALFPALFSGSLFGARLKRGASNRGM